MSGYHNFSMSNNAISAYESGEMPRSKWTKGAIIDAISEIAKDYSEINVSGFKKVRAEILREQVLRRSSWHHTSSYFNETVFYTVSVNDVLSANKRIDKLQAAKVEKIVKPEVKRVRAHYLEWSGTRKHPKATDCEAVGEIRGNWFYPDGESFKKSTTAKGFQILETL
jgi:hypothetical protein